MFSFMVIKVRVAHGNGLKSNVYLAIASGAKSQTSLKAISPCFRHVQLTYDVYSLACIMYEVLAHKAPWS